LVRKNWLPSELLIDFERISEKQDHEKREVSAYSVVGSNSPFIQMNLKQDWPIRGPRFFIERSED